MSKDNKIRLNTITKYLHIFGSALCSYLFTFDKLLSEGMDYMVKKGGESIWYFTLISGLVAIPIVLFVDILKQLYEKIKERIDFISASFQILQSNWIQLIAMIAIAVFVTAFIYKAKESTKKETKLETKVIRTLNRMNRTLNNMNQKLDILASNKVVTKNDNNKENDAQN